MKSLTGAYFLAHVNSIAASISFLLPIENLSRAYYVCEDVNSSVITQFKLDCAGLGDKQPRLAYARKPFCPACPVRVPNTGLHLLFSCGAVSALRIETGIQSYVTLCQHKGLSLTDSYLHFVNGLDTNGNPVSKHEYLERGKCMRDMRDTWLSKW